MYHQAFANTTSGAFLQPYGPNFNSALISQATDRPAFLMAHSVQPGTRSPGCHAFSF